MPSNSLPQRTSLVSETVRVLREAILAGRWQGRLPGERRLCEEWRISRPTLRAALAVLAGEGIVKIAQGRPTEVSISPEPGSPAPTDPILTVGLLSPEPLHAMPPFALLWLDELRGQLAAEGHLLHVHVGRSWFNNDRNPARALATLTSATPAAVWVLYRSTESMQRWFEQQQIPCVIVGSPFAGIKLPSVDQDYRAVCRHAVGVLARQERNRLALVIQEPQFAGDRESEAGFEEGLAAVAKAGVTGSLYQHDGTRAGILKAVDQLLNSRQRPTGLIVARSAAALTVCTALLARGLRIPQDIAVVCRDDDVFLDDAVPSIARYTVSPSGFAKRLFRLIQQPGARQDSKVMPSFLKAESL